MGNMNGSYGSHYTLRLDAYVLRQGSSSENYSTIRADLWLDFDGSSYYAYTNNTTSGWININGTSQNFSVGSINFSSGVASSVYLGTLDVNVGHNDDGTCGAIGVSGYWNTNTSRIGAGSTSTSVTPPRIDRYANAYSISITGTEIDRLNFHVTTDRNSRVFVLISSPISTNWLNNGNPFSSNTTDHWFDVTYQDRENTERLKPNTSYQFTVLVRDSVSGLDRFYYNQGGKTANIATISEAPNINIGQSHTVKWNNPTSAETKLKLCYPRIAGSNLLNMPYTENNKLTVKATRDDYYVLTDYYAELEAGKPYVFNVETDGTLGEGSNKYQQEIFLVRDKDYGKKFYNMDGHNFIFVPEYSGKYYVRYDVNKNGETHSFWNFSVGEAETIEDYGVVTGTSKETTPPSNKIYPLIPNSNTITLKYILTTTRNNIPYSNIKDCTFSVVNSNPIFEDFDFNDINPKTINLTNNRKIFIKGYSNVEGAIISLYAATPQNEATMSNYKMVIGNKSNNNILYKPTAVTSGIIEKVESGEVAMYAVDSRGNSTGVTKTAILKEYTDLVIRNSTAERSNNGVGKSVILKIEGTFWNDNFGFDDNSVTNATYQYKETSQDDTQWVDGETLLTITQNEDRFYCEEEIRGDLGADGFDISKSYDFKVTVTDRLVSKTFNFTLGSGTPAIAIYKSAVAIGAKYDTDLGGDFQMNGDVYLNGQNLSGMSGVPANTIVDYEGDEVPDGWEVFAEPTYSTNEVKTGETWINNKTIYRKVVFVNFGSQGTNTVYSPHNISNLEMIIRQSLVWFDTEDKTWYVDNKDKGTNQYNVYLDAVGLESIKIKQDTTVNWQGRTKDRYCILEYTKTTD